MRVFTGAAFDLVGEPKRTNFHIDHNRLSSEESFEIRLRNRKATPVNILVNEHLFRGATWDVFTSSQAFQKRDSQLIEFSVTVLPGEEKVVTYSVRYSWWAGMHRELRLAAKQDFGASRLILTRLAPPIPV